MTLHEKQVLFFRLLARLPAKITELGLEATCGEVWRPPATAEYYALRGLGIVDSLHIERLALDLNLFRNGVWLKDTEDYRPLGEFWKSLNILCRWGGDFKKRPDGGHFSLSHEGRA